MSVARYNDLVYMGLKYGRFQPLFGEGAMLRQADIRVVMMSILATNMGFSAAISNPYTLGVSQQLAGLPLFSGAWLRVIIFIAIYAIFMAFLTAYARKIDRDPKASARARRRPR